MLPPCYASRYAMQGELYWGVNAADGYTPPAVQPHPHGGQFEFARSSARTPHGGASYVEVSRRNQERHPPERFYRPCCVGRYFSVDPKNTSWEQQWFAGGNGDGSLTYPGTATQRSSSGHSGPCCSLCVSGSFCFTLPRWAPRFGVCRVFV